MLYFLFLAIVAYGRNSVDERKELWEFLRIIANSITDPWCLLGDFNAVLDSDDHQFGQDITMNEMRDF